MDKDTQITRDQFLELLNATSSLDLVHLLQRMVDHARQDIKTAQMEVLRAKEFETGEYIQQAQADAVAAKHASILLKALHRFVSHAHIDSDTGGAPFDLFGPRPVNLFRPGIKKGTKA